MNPTPAPTRTFSFARLMTICISARLLVDIGVQMFNPFLPIFAAGLNTDVIVMGRLVSLRSSMGLFAPFFGSLADRTSYRRVLTFALLAISIAMWIIGSSTGVAQAAVGMTLLGLGLACFIPTLLAYLGARLPYAQLARGMGMLEYSWALTGIIGLSLMGLLIAATSWRVPFFVLGTGMAFMALVLRALPPARDHKIPLSRADAPLPTQSRRERIADFFRIETNAVSTYATIITLATNQFAAILFAIIHGVWFADQYGFGPRELGYVALIFGCFDLAGSVSVSLFTDRFGKRRSVLLGTTGAMIGYLLIPWLNVAVVPAVLSAALARGFFEFAIVANLPLLSVQSPNQRAKVMTLSTAVGLGTSTISSFVAPLLYTRIGITGIATISAICSAFALFLLLTRVHEGVETHHDPVV